MRNKPYRKYTTGKLRHVIACVILLLICIPRTHAQKADSLRNLLAEYNHDDTTRVNLLIELSRIYKDTAPDSMMALAVRARALAEKKQFFKGIGEGWFQAGVAYTMTGKLDSSLVAYNKALDIFRTHNMPRLECKVLDDIGVSYYRQGKLDESRSFMEKSLAIATKYRMTEETGRALLRIGDIYRDKALYSDALAQYLKALGVYEKNNMKSGIAESYRDMADIYSLLGNNERALECIQKSSALYKEGDDLQAILVNYTSTGAVYGQMKDFNKALAAYKSALQLADTMHNAFWQGICLLNIGECFVHMNITDSAMIYYQAALKDAQMSKDATAEAYCHRGLGMLFLEKHNAPQAIHHLLIAYAHASEIGEKREIFEISDQLSHAYELNKDYVNALKYTRIYQLYRDTLFNEDNLKRIEQLQKDYELNKKEAQIQLLNKDKLIKQGNYEKQRAIVWGLVSGVACLAVIITLLVISRRAEKRNKQQLIAQRDAIQVQAGQLEELNNFKDKTFSVLSHDLKGPLASFTSAMAMLDEEDITKEELAEIKPEINRQLGSLNMLLDNLLSWSRSHIQGEKALNWQMIDLGLLAGETVSIATIRAEDKQINIHNTIAPGTTAYADRGQIDVVIRNLVNNAIKFTRPGGVITLAAIDKGGKISVSVADNGVGMTEEQLGKIFKVAKDKSTYGTGGEKGVGLGLLMCYEFVTANNGTIAAVSELGKGSTFTFTLPRA